ncbi:hypothetical protein A2344_02505 [Candidatus Peregrinibacteria bacterium RIFOXYB12_FULL_41_12]|nr:MAG: hypothetical protein A2244_00605 [Candidatus Peregrinibacteria bacterium RIFOXYA2_FULL_41_18]OGJ49645.1 MAG: hypothetical protein A2344_02505 [Candidatus Peregrinibacteria bacterium RIFOXYB12_FULL_41_12]OGJ53904.1 MAG: hypothetical protein A2336_00630 [Candidatus Peregrinibacteria bacterium RIFOXYB2_FULL_41_88]
MLPSLGSEEEFELRDLIEIKSTPTLKENKIEPVIYADAAYALDITSNTILYTNNEHDKLAIASLTKLMTAYIILEEEQLGDIVTVSRNASSKEGSKMWLGSGETITVEALLYGLLIQSGNDAATALAEFNAGSEENFVEKMNQKAKLLGLDETHFTTASGIDDEGYSTAQDLARLSMYLLKNDFIRNITSLTSATVTGTDGYPTHNLTSTNELLDSYLNVKGLKTGKTGGAGECLIAVGENAAQHEILTVMLGSEDRFGETKLLLDWIYNSYVW